MHREDGRCTYVGKVGGHPVACLRQPIAKVDFNPLRHTPAEVEVYSGEGRASCSHQIISNKHLSEVEDVVGDVEAPGLAGLKVPHPVVGNELPRSLRF